MKAALFGLSVLYLVFWGCTSKVTQRINGVSLEASRDSIFQQDLEPIQELHANYVAVMPLGFVRNLEDPQIFYDSDRQWFGETVKGTKQYIEMLHANKVSVMLKPQLWIWRGEFTGHLTMTSETDWKILEDAYRKFIMEYARVASEEQVALFCIGTELEQFIKQRPQFWKHLIAEIRTRYKGKLTYAANWDEYKHTDIWKDLDYIGIDAYFPISDKKNPSLDSCKERWQRWKLEMLAISDRFGKPILFTEYGYRSMDFAGKEPWASHQGEDPVNLDAQQTLLEALYSMLWQEDWFAGGFLWKWHLAHEKVGGADNTRFTPQNKPAQNIVKIYYSKQP